MSELRAQLQPVAAVAAVDLAERYACVETRRRKTRLAGISTGAERQAANAEVLQSSGVGETTHVGLGTFLPATAYSFFRGELQRVQRRHRVGAISKAAAQRSVNARSNVEPRARHDDGVDEWSFDAVEDGWLVAFVDDADRHQHHASPDVQTSRQEEIDVRL